MAVETMQFVERIRAAWDGTAGEHNFGPQGKSALLAMADLPRELIGRSWDVLTADEQRSVIAAARHMMQLSRKLS